MKKTIFNVLLFTAGAAIGSLVTWRLLKSKYERIAQEEIDSVKETWRRMRDKNVDSQNDSDTECEEYDDDSEYESDEEDTAVMTKYHDLANMYRMSRGTETGKDTETGEEGETDHDVKLCAAPYVIRPEDFGDGNYDHELHSLTYYADGILANDWYETLDLDDTIGEDSIEHIGDYTEDVVHVRNERLQADYEVVRDYRKFVDAVASDPSLRAYDET